jgi:hypothetical protein
MCGAQAQVPLQALRRSLLAPLCFRVIGREKTGRATTSLDTVTQFIRGVSASRVVRLSAQPGKGSRICPSADAHGPSDTGPWVSASLPKSAAAPPPLADLLCLSARGPPPRQSGWGSVHGDAEVGEKAGKYLDAGEVSSRPELVCDLLSSSGPPFYRVRGGYGQDGGF